MLSDSGSILATGQLSNDNKESLNENPFSSLTYLAFNQIRYKIDETMCPNKIMLVESKGNYDSLTCFAQHKGQEVHHTRRPARENRRRGSDCKPRTHHIQHCEASRGEDPLQEIHQDGDRSDPSWR